MSRVPTFTVAGPTGSDAVVVLTAHAAGWTSTPREDCDRCDTRADHVTHEVRSARTYLRHLPDDDAHQETA